MDPDVSRWTLAARGVEISWKASKFTQLAAKGMRFEPRRQYLTFSSSLIGNTEVRRGEIIAWKSESGLPNRGRVLFQPEGKSKSQVTLAIEFDVPAAIAKAVNNDFVGKFVEETLLADLQRFREVALALRRRARTQGIAASPEAKA